MENFLKVVNELQDVFCTVGASPDILRLPQIVVVGSQSAGKSSVLESIVKKDFLPRGGGIVTRRPLIIQITQDLSLSKPWACFLHNLERKFTDFDEVREEIIAETDRLCGTDKGIKGEPIILKIYANDLPTLTLVDLPGIVKVPVGDQPEDIEEQTLRLIKTFADNPNSLILAVTPGNIDLANSDALKISREVDPRGERTLAVITKADLMEKSVENRLVLEGKTIPVKLGIIGVINRSQRKVDESQGIEESLEDEEIFFKSNYNYISGEMGTPYLTKRLCQILMERVKECLPDVILRINEQKTIQQEILESLGPKVDFPLDTLTVLIYEFCQKFMRTMEGTKTLVLSNGKKVSSGQYLFQAFESTICNDLDELKLPDHIEKLIEDEIESSCGSKPALFTPNVVFDNLASNQVLFYSQPLKKSIKKCSEIITEIIVVLSKQVFVQFPNLRREAHHIAFSLLVAKTQIADKFLDDYLLCEVRYTNTNHRLFVKERELIEKAEENKDAEDAQFCNRNVKKIRAFLELYTNIIKNQLMDVAPKTVMSTMIYSFQTELHKALVTRLTNPAKLVDLMQEDVFIEEKREKATKMLQALAEADSVTCLMD